MSVTHAAANGSRRDLLLALRWRCGVTFHDPSTPASALVPLSKALGEIAAELTGLDPGRRRRRA